MSLKICAVGDIMPGEGPYFLDRGIRTKLRKNNPFTVFEEVNPLLKGDIVIGNLEVPLSRKDETPWLKSRTFRGDPETARFLSEAGFNYLNIANNHFLGHGYDSATESYNLLVSSGITPIGWTPEMSRGEIYCKLVSINGHEVGIISLCDIPTTLSSGIRQRHFLEIENEIVVKTIDSAKQKCDLLIISVHWGSEYIHEVAPSIKKLANKWISNGVDLILGHGPHVLQGFKRREKSGCVFSMGNFLFDQLFMGETQVGGIFYFEWDNGITRHSFIPTKTTSNFHIEALSDDEKRIWEEKYRSLCDNIDDPRFSDSDYARLAKSGYRAMQSKNLRHTLSNLHRLSFRSAASLMIDSRSRLSNLIRS